MSEKYGCSKCSREFDTERGKNIHEGFHDDEVKEWKRKDVLNRLYNDEDMSSIEIADKYDVHPTTIRDLMDEHGLEKEIARHDPKRPPNHKFHNTGKCVGTEYERIETTHGGDKHIVQIHRLLAIATGKLSVADFKNPSIVVHHKSGHGLDNRPENIEVMERGDHQTKHNIERYS